jgi:hypothetical protein
VTEVRDANTSRHFNLYVLRRLNNKDEEGRGAAGRIHRERLHTTITPLTMYALSTAVPMKKGGYGAPVVELGIRFLMAMIGLMDVKKVGEELALAILDQQKLVSHMEELVIFLRDYQKS